MQETVGYCLLPAVGRLLFSRLSLKRRLDTTEFRIVILAAWPLFPESKPRLGCR
jgi:hypothetical protein